MVEKEGLSSLLMVISLIMGLWPFPWIKQGRCQAAFLQYTFFTPWTPAIPGWDLIDPEGFHQK